jgi:hypothetical protein
MNVGIKSLTSRKKAILACGGTMVLLAGILSVGILPAQQVTAQIGNQTGNATGGNQTAGTIGKLKVLDLATEILETKVQVKLLQALQSAVDQLGPDAHIVRAELTISGDDVVYKVVGISEGRIHIITIDPVDGAVLDSKNFSLRELLAMHGGGLPNLVMNTTMMLPPMMGQ